jgi:hypothetical protein
MTHIRVRRGYKLLNRRYAPIMLARVKAVQY